MRILKVYVEYKFTAQIRITEVSRRCVVISGFHNVAFGQGGMPISCSVFRYASWFQPFKAYSASRVFTLFVSRFFNGGRNVKLYYVTSITKFNW